MDENEKSTDIKKVTIRNNIYSSKEIVKMIFSAGTVIIIIMFVKYFLEMMANDFLSVEGIISILLAFFSMFISIFFYFKADETSNKFYDSSYEFMKEQSILLGRIEERFGEKFDSVISKLGDLEEVKKQKEKEIYVTQEDTYEIVKEMKKNIANDDKVNIDKLGEYIDKLFENNNKYQQLRTDLDKLQNETRNLSKVSFDSNFCGNRLPTVEDQFSFINSLERADILYIKNHYDITNNSHLFYLAKKYNVCGKDGSLYPWVIEAIDKMQL